MRTCSKCDSIDVPDNAERCPFCGHVLTEKEDDFRFETFMEDMNQEPQSLSETDGDDVKSKNMFKCDKGENSVVSKKKKGRHMLWIMITVMCLFVGIFSVSKMSENTSDEDEVLMETQEDHDEVEESEKLEDERDTSDNTGNEVTETQESEHIDVNVEEEVLLIREKYNEIVAGIGNNEYSEIFLEDGIVAYYGDGRLQAVIVEKGIGGNYYRRSYYYADDILFFAYYEDKDAHRFYFFNEQLIRWRYSENSMEAQAAVNHDMEQTEDYFNWEEFVLNESSLFRNVLNSSLEWNNDENHLTGVSATSALSEYGMTHAADRLMDNDLSTAWVEGVNGQGIGETVSLVFDGKYIINGLRVNAGYHKNADLYQKNSRPKLIRISFSDGTSLVYTLLDKMDCQNIAFEKAIITEYISLEIESVYPRIKYEDTAISELVVY